MRVKSEHSEQVTLVNRIRHFYPDVILFAIPNGGRRDPKEAVRLKAEGVLPGVPDLMIARPVDPYHGLFIEMKRSKGGRLSEAQTFMAERLNSEGYLTVCCHGANDAWQVVVDYLG